MREQLTLKAATEDELRATGAMGEREAAAWAEALTFHHQWMVLSREHAAALVALRKEVILVGALSRSARALCSAAGGAGRRRGSVAAEGGGRQCHACVAAQGPCLLEAWRRASQEAAAHAGMHAAAVTALLLATLCSRARCPALGVPQFGRAIHRATNSVRAGMAPDEFIVVTALKAHGLVKSVQVGPPLPAATHPPSHCKPASLGACEASPVAPGDPRGLPGTRTISS
jgi:hypothetical protein